MPGIVRVQWRRDPKGYDVLDEYYYSDAYSTKMLVPRSPYYEPSEKRDQHSYVLEGTENRLFLELANAPRTVEGALAFVNKWGAPPDPDQLGGGRLALQSFYNMAATIRGAVRLARRDPIDAIEQLGRTRDWKPGVQLTLRFGRLLGDSTPRIYLDAADLFEFCKAEFMQMLEGGAEIRDCGNCGTLLALGRVGQQPSYCSDRCRVAMHRKNKREREKRQKR
jgi:hypothetical protein